MRLPATLTLLLCQWVSCYVLGSFCPKSRACAAGKRREKKKEKKGQNSCRDTLFGSGTKKCQEIRVEKCIAPAVQYIE